MTHIINGKSYEAHEIVQAIQRHLGCPEKDLELMGTITHAFRTCLQWQATHKGIPYTNWKQPHLDYEAYMGGVLPDAARVYFMEVLECDLRLKKAVTTT